MKVMVKNINKSFSIYPALNNVTLSVPSGDLIALLGPSGSGKTTLLRVIAGLEVPESGQILFNSSDVTGVPVQKRNIGFVFQQYALFPHMTVAENIGYGLRMRLLSSSTVCHRVKELLDLMQLDGLGNRYPAEISGGQQQRVALARALAPDPSVLLLDEPFGALDAQVRTELRQWLRRLHDEINITTVFVTHDQEEAFEVADRIAILNAGKIEQIGTPSDIYDYPANMFVMNFIGANNTLNGYIRDGYGHFGDFKFLFTGRCEDSQRALACIRRKDISITRTPGKQSSMPGQICDARRVGMSMKITVKCNNISEKLIAELPYEYWESQNLHEESNVYISMKNVQIFPETNPVAI